MAITNIFYRDNVHQMHQIHIQLHELAHYLLGHKTITITREMLNDSRSGIIELPFNELARLRSPEIDQIEQEAETLATLIQQRVIHNSNIKQLTAGISSDENIAATLKDLGMI